MRNHHEFQFSKPVISIAWLRSGICGPGVSTLRSCCSCCLVPHTPQHASLIPQGAGLSYAPPPTTRLFSLGPLLSHLSAPAYPSHFSVPAYLNHFSALAYNSHFSVPAYPSHFSVPAYLSHFSVPAAFAIVCKFAWDWIDEPVPEPWISDMAHEASD